MYTIKFTSAYKKSYKRISKRGYDLSLLNDVVDMLRRGVELPEQYRDHILQGEFERSRHLRCRLEVGDSCFSENCALSEDSASYTLYYNIFVVNTPNIQLGCYPSRCLSC